jgi:hypothetical protein
MHFGMLARSKQNKQRNRQTQIDLPSRPPIDNFQNLANSLHKAQFNIQNACFVPCCVFLPFTPSWFSGSKTYIDLPSQPPINNLQNLANSLHQAQFNIQNERFRSVLRFSVLQLVLLSGHQTHIDLPSQPPIQPFNNLANSLYQAQFNIQNAKSKSRTDKVQTKSNPDKVQSKQEQV